METLEEFKTAINEQVNKEKQHLLQEIESNGFSVIIGYDGEEISVEESVKNVIFGEDDLAEQFVEQNSEYALEDLRDLQIEAINSISDVIEANEQARYKYRYVEHDLKLNAALNNRSYYLREDTVNSVFEIVSEDYLQNDYRDEISILKSFESKEAALNFVDQFRTDEHYDIKGLWAMTEAIDDENLSTQ